MKDRVTPIGGMSVLEVYYKGNNEQRTQVEWREEEKNEDINQLKHD